MPYFRLEDVQVCSLADILTYKRVSLHVHSRTSVAFVSFVLFRVCSWFQPLTLKNWNHEHTRNNTKRQNANGTSDYTREAVRSRRKPLRFRLRPARSTRPRSLL